MGETGETGEMGETCKTGVTEIRREGDREGGGDRHRPRVASATKKLVA